ncbi:MAG: hypothetical protein OEV43_01955 [Coriobacteriia bacterium]|nr:hypothetical protein [Coriobacteriia bacterium]
MQRTRSGPGYGLAIAFGAFVGGLAVIWATDAIPKMADKMMARMAEGGMPER